MGRNLIETVMGAVVLAIAIGFLAFVYNQSSIKEVDGYIIKASFDDLSGIAAGSQVRIGGVKVGVVESLDLDPKTFLANAHMTIQNDVKLPKDSSAAVVSNGLLGEKFIKLEPGGDDATLAAGDAIKFTQSSVSFEELIGKFVFSSGGVDGKKGDKEGAGDAPAAKSEKDESSEGKENPFSLGF